MRIIILSKAPVVGRVKTRLMSKYSDKQAADIHKQMLNAVLLKVCSLFDDVWLAVDSLDHVHFKSLQKNFDFKLVSQGLGDLGGRLSHLMHVSFEQDNEPILFLGTDSPHVALQRYKDTERALLEFQIVIGPVEDGGYDLIGMNQPCPELFENIQWGSDRVFEETMSVISRLKLTAKELDISFDLDRPEDLERAPPESW